MTTKDGSRELSDAEYLTLGVLPMSRLPDELRSRINLEAASSYRPSKWFPPLYIKAHSRELSRGWFEWHIRRGRDPRKRRTSISEWMRDAVIARDGMICGLCVQPVESRSDLHIDHIQPWSRGGVTVVANLQPAHAACNIAKGNQWEGYQE